MTKRAIITASLLALAVPAAAEKSTVRLGTDVVPVRQSVRLVVDPEQEDYEGSVSIVLRADAETRRDSEPLRHAQDDVQLAETVHDDDRVAAGPVDKILDRGAVHRTVGEFHPDREGL